MVASKGTSLVEAALSACGGSSLVKAILSGSGGSFSVMAALSASGITMQVSASPHLKKIPRGLDAGKLPTDNSAMHQIVWHKGSPCRGIDGGSTKVCHGSLHKAPGARKELLFSLANLFDIWLVVHQWFLNFSRHSKMFYWLCIRFV